MADDHKIVRQSPAWMLQETPGTDVVGQAVGGRQVVDLATTLRPDVVIVLPLTELDIPGL